MILIALSIAAILIGPLGFILGRHAGHEHAYQEGHDDGYYMGRVETLAAAEDNYRQLEQDLDDARAENYDLEQALAACAGAVHALPGGAA